MEQNSREVNYTRLLTIHRRPLYAFIYSLLADHADAEDVYQRCSMILWDKFDQYDPSREFLSWAMGIAFYEVKNFLRVSSRDRHHFSEQLIEQLFEQMPARQSDHNVYLRSLEQCLKSLPKNDLQLVRKVYWDRCTVSSVAKDLGVAMNTLYDRMGRIRHRLRKCVSLRSETGVRSV
ncbi:RNA polymerase sigma factor [Planctomycetes bacterium Pan216]|uniref:RNA polymerase sigma factor n=1 Tax=Kolteria novifilia TaxID=2527975 RepID=A0A518AZK6_9BACT|nr:RNA polymerase sigma factor [Planctomycetes bacterium Pan216]